MNLYDKQTKWGIAVIVVALVLICGGSMYAYSELNPTNQDQETSEVQTNEATLQEFESSSVGADAATDLIGGELIPVVAQPQQWRDVGEGHCLLVRVSPPWNQPDKLTATNTVKVPIDVCWALIQSIERIVELGFISYEDLLFTPGTSL